MKRTNLIALSVSTALVALATGCASNDGPVRAKADDGRTLVIGKATPAPGGGTNYQNPHMEKCWLADGFNFNGYDTLFIAPAASTAKYPDKPEDKMVHDRAKDSLVSELAREIKARNIFTSVVTQESEIKPGAKVLRMENTITEFVKGGGAARYFVGMYGGGQPVLRVEGKMTDATKPVFTYQARRSGVSAGSRVGGAFMRDEDIQIQDIRSMSLDLADFMSVVSGKFARK